MGTSAPHETGDWQLVILGNIESGAGNGTRTRDPLLGKQMLYQLSYSRSFRTWLQPLTDFRLTNSA